MREFDETAVILGRSVAGLMNARVLTAGASVFFVNQIEEVR